MGVLATGATGRLGRHVVDALLAAGHQVRRPGMRSGLVALLRHFSHG